MKLNSEFVDKLSGYENPKKFFDGKGMYLYLQPSGAKYWRLKYRYEGREKTYAIGVYPRVSLDDARQKTDAARQQLRQGIDPSEFKQNQGFEVVAREWFENQREGWKDRHAGIVLNSLEKDVFPYIGTRNVNAIRPPELLTVIRRIEKRNAYQVATKVLQRVGAVFRYAVQTGRSSSNPATELLGVVKTKKVQHSKSLPLSDLPVFIHAVKNYEGMPSIRYAILLMLLTFVRTDELRKATWDEFNLDKRVWRLPEARTKMNTVHIVPLSDQAIALLKTLPTYRAYPNSGYLFEGRKKGKPISDKAMIHAVYRMGYKNKATIHGFRSMAKTTLVESGLFTAKSIRRQLAHLEGSAVERAYDHAQLLKERTRMMQWWADYLDSVQGIKSKKMVIKERLSFLGRFINFK